MKMVRLGEVAEFVRGVTFKPNDTLDDGTGVPVMRTKNVQARLELSDVIRIPANLVKNESKYLRHGDTLISSANSWNLVGKCAWVPELSEPAAIGGFVTALRPDSSTVSPRYIYHWFSTPLIQSVVRSFGNRTTSISNLSIKRCLQLELPLPPLAEQRRIAAILDKADAIRQKRRQAISHLDTLTQSIFQDMFGEIETWTTIGELAESTQYGTSAKAGGTGEWPVLRMGNITYEGQLDLSDLKYLDLQPNDVSKYTVCRGDLLFNRTNSAELVGKTCVVNVDAPLAFAGYLIRARFPRIETAVTVSAYLNSPRGKATLRHMAKAIVGQANINATELRSIRVPAVPEVSENQFVSRVNGLTSSSALFQKQLHNDNLLFASLQSRAFRGEL